MRRNKAGTTLHRNEEYICLANSRIPTRAVIARASRARNRVNASLQTQITNEMDLRGVLY